MCDSSLGDETFSRFGTKHCMCSLDTSKLILMYRVILPIHCFSE
jgi:hypothetical protein